MDTKKKRIPGQIPDTPAEKPAAGVPGTPAVPAPGNPQEKNRAAMFMLGALALAAAVLLGCYLLQVFPFAPAPEETGTAGNTVYFFYGAECPHCHEVKPYVESLRDKYPDTEIQVLETWHVPANNALLRLLSHRAGRESIAVPQVIIGKKVLLGKDEIQSGLEPAIIELQGNLTGSSAVGASPSYGTTADTTIRAVYYYGNGCSHCDAVKPLIADIRARYPELSLDEREINDNRTNLELFLATPLPEGSGSEYSIPAIFIGETALIGETAVSGHLEEDVLAEKARLSAATPGVPATTGVPGATTVPVEALYFYSDSCSHCEKVKPVIANISARYPALALVPREINHDADNREYFNDISRSYNISNPGVPVIFIGNTFLIGEGEISSRLEQEILAEQQRLASGGTPRSFNLTPSTGPGTPPETPAFNPYMVMFAALVDSMNPCGLSVLVFLLLTMTGAGDRKRILLVGGVYIAAMFLFHLLVGIGLFSALAISGLTKPFSILGGLIALVLGIVTLADVLRNRETYLLSIPESRKGLLGTYARKATVPAAFVLGVLAGILGFSCTGGIYISILGLIGRDMTFLAGLPWLVLYNIVFVLPLALVTLLVAFGISPERAEQWRTENKRTVRIVIGLILVALGLIILLGWFG